MSAETVAPAWTRTPITAEEYASYWRVEQVASGVPLVYTYVLDPASRDYRGSDVFAGVIRTMAPFSVEIDLSVV